MKCVARRYVLQVFLLSSLLSVRLLRADPIIQLVERATPPQRIVLILTYFDSNRVAIQNKKAAFQILAKIDELGRSKHDEQLRQYGQFLRDTYEKNSNTLTNRQKAELFLNARAYLMCHQLDSCLHFLTESKQLYRLNTNAKTFGSNLGDENYLRNYCDVARQYYLAVNDLPKAYWYLDSMTVLDQRINKRYNSEQISLVEQRLLIQKHQTEVATLEDDRHKQRIQFWVAATVLTLIAALFWRLYQLSLLKRRQEAAINAEREKSWRLEKQLVEEELQRAHEDLAVFMDNLRERNALIDSITARLQDQSATHDTDLELPTTAELLQQLFNTTLLTNEDWEEFRRHFERVHPDFFALLTLSLHL